MFCGCPEQLGDGTPSLKLQTNRPLCVIRDALPGVSKDEVWKWVDEASQRWGAVCDWKLARIGDVTDAKASDVVLLVTAANLGQGGVLADQQLPYTGGSILRMRINTRIAWSPTDLPMPSGKIDPIRTICHELGHFQGHSHWPIGAPNELMEPTVSHTIIRPQPTEAKVSAEWFGKVPSPNPIPPPPPIPPTPNANEVFVLFRVNHTLKKADVISVT